MRILVPNFQFLQNLIRRFKKNC